MKFLRLCMSVILSICLVVSTIGSDLFGASMMSVKATGSELALGLDVMYEICEYFGSTFMTYSCGRSLPEITDDELARLGHDFLRAYSETMYEFGLGPDPTSFDGSLAMVDYNGQSYVFGTEALKETAETEFTVIQGGKNNGDDNDDDDDEDEDNVIHFPQKVAGAGKLAVAMTTSLASLAFSCVAAAYHKWVNGDEDNLLDSFFERNADLGFTGYDDIKQSNSDYVYTFSAVSHIKSSTPRYDTYYVYYEGTTTYSGRIAAYYSSDNYNIYFYDRSNRNMFRFPFTSTAIGDNGLDKSVSQSSSWSISGGSADNFLGLSCSANFPVFSDIAAMNNAFNTGDFTDALNYTKEYRNADWLQDDWSGELIDPLTGLNALSNWYNIARHQGLNALGDNPSVNDMGDYLRDYFAQLGTDVLPEVDPSLAPIKYPATLPDVVIDPTANPAVSPATNPGIDPSPGVDPNPGTDPGINIKPNPDTVVDIPIEDIVPTVEDSFMDIASSLKYKFPFSIPWDIHHIFSVLADNPKAPYFELPLVIERYGINERVVIDMSRFQVLSNLSRSMFSMLFAIFLINLTFRVVAMRKEE